MKIEDTLKKNLKKSLSSNKSIEDSYDPENEPDYVGKSKHQQDIADRETDRDLKINIKKHIIKIIYAVIVFCCAIIIIDISSFLYYKEHIYSEWFLAVLLGSQLVILPFSLLLVITKSLFPTSQK